MWTKSIQFKLIPLKLNVGILLVMLLLLGACTPVQRSADGDLAATEAAAEQTATVVVAEATAEAGGDTAVIVDEETVDEETLNNELGDEAVIAPATSSLLTGDNLLDHDFTNPSSTVNGEIEDVLLDFNSGRVLFATLEYGGFLDIGDTEIPIPLQAFQRGTEGELILDFDEARLEALPDLGGDWPNLTDDTWDDDIVQFWQEANVDPGFDFANNTNIIVWLSDLVDQPVGDIGFGEGRVEDVLIDMNEDRIKYVMLDYGPLLGDQFVAVPFSAFNTQVYNGNIQFGADLDADTISSAPQFTTAQLEAAELDPTLDTDSEQYWTERGFMTEE